MFVRGPSFGGGSKAYWSQWSPSEWREWDAKMIARRLNWIEQQRWFEKVRDVVDANLQAEAEAEADSQDVPIGGEGDGAQAQVEASQQQSFAGSVQSSTGSVADMSMQQAGHAE